MHMLQIFVSRLTSLLYVVNICFTTIEGVQVVLFTAIIPK